MEAALRQNPVSLRLFVLHMPEKILAGEGIVVTIKAHDAYGNLIKDFDKTSKRILRQLCQVRHMFNLQYLRRPPLSAAGQQLH